MATITETEKDFMDFLKEQNALREAISLIQWDLRTKIPKKGVEQRSEVVGYLAQKLHQMQVSDKMKNFIDELKEQTSDQLIQKSVQECLEIYEKNQKIPENEFKEYVMLQSKSEAVWQDAREKANFSDFQPYLEKLVDFNKKFANYWGYEENIYDALLHNFEPGVTVKTLDEVFPKVRKSLTELLQKIQDSSVKPDTSILTTHFPKKDQKNFSIEILNRMGYDFDAGRLDDTIHPFEITLNLNDVRITTRYDEQDFRMAVFGIIHEAGHALYEQNIDKKLEGTPLASGTSMGIHESQSLFWENFLGRNKVFWESHYDLFKKYAPIEFDKVSVVDFYQAVNEVKPSFIRIEADELTYPLHIMVRYELEKALINGDIEVKELPHLWNEKMVEYLGIKPPTDREGVLQDIHWAGGDFGYFPSYALGYMYAAQFKHKMSETLDVDGIIQSGDFSKIRNWLTENIHQYGKLKKPLDILKDVTGEGLNPDYLVEYLTTKYRNIYQF
ncbi:carboxypeptidase M32 [Ornithinibacillus bavariensis]|uniref:Metal-dependent carboxypeptidase n=1 Tax=Ornithinibacillus bavariensis TaxID=545502 RepID=A0A920C8N6_9BACI|nr:carboxypeptidase M32 [Ornithinibacillus bavariensis]GIO28419.1 carboxypeptidase M32 [Ornithinibacillus bavariensis]